jgi:hypothetical protein
MIVATALAIRVINKNEIALKSIFSSLLFEDCGRGYGRIVRPHRDIWQAATALSSPDCQVVWERYSANVMRPPKSLFNELPSVSKRYPGDQTVLSIEMVGVLTMLLTGILSLAEIEGIRWSQLKRASRLA